MTVVPDYARELKVIRAMLRLTQAELANRLGVNGPRLTAGSRAHHPAGPAITDHADSVQGGHTLEHSAHMQAGGVYTLEGSSPRTERHPRVVTPLQA